jgi:ankyrin repeat protein
MYNNQNNINITNLLISAGSNLNYQNKNGYSALMIGE